MSVIIPVFNREQYLEEALASVRLQGRGDIEIVVVDDGSEDRSVEIARAFAGPVQVIEQEHKGAGAARNKAIAAARGQILAFLDSDDIWAPEKLNKQVAVLAQDPSVMIVTGMIREFLSPEISTDTGTRPPAERAAGHVASAVTVRRTAAEAIGPFREDVVLGEWADWWIRGTELGLPTVMLPDVVAHRRIHRSNLGLVAADRRLDYVSVIKASLDRRRAK